MKADPVNESVGLIMDSINIFIRRQYQLLLSSSVNHLFPRLITKAYLPVSTVVQILATQSNRK